MSLAALGDAARDLAPFDEAYAPAGGSCVEHPPPFRAAKRTDADDTTFRWSGS